LPDDEIHPDKPAMQDGIVLNYKLRGKELVELTTHVLARMKQRGISQQDVLNAIEKPTKSVPQTQVGGLRFRWQKTARTFIDVIFEDGKDRVIVITAVKISGSLIRIGRHRK
jgi:Domain of unknown function (DUF4258)